MFYVNEGGWVRQNTTVVGSYLIAYTMTTCHRLTNKIRSYDSCVLTDPPTLNQRYVTSQKSEDLLAVTLLLSAHRH